MEDAPNVSIDGLSASEAIFGFCGWLTTRKEKTVMSFTDECSPIVERITEFCKANNLADPRSDYSALLEHPKEDKK